MLRTAPDKKVKSIELWFTDVPGFARRFTITHDEPEGAIAEGMGFDGSSVQGFARIDESDMMAVPDVNTFAILPYRPKDAAVVARMFCRIREPDGTPYKGDPRHVPRKNLQMANKLGHTLFVGPELEYFSFKSDRAPEILDRGGLSR